MPELLSEAETASRFDTRTKLVTQGNYGCEVLVFGVDDAEIASRQDWLNDAHFRELRRFAPNVDIGTVVIDGDLTLTHDATITPNLMCLIITGDLSAPALCVRETEFVVYGDMKVGSVTDHDEYITVHGERQVSRYVTYDD